VGRKRGMDKGRGKRRTAHLAPTYQLPDKISPFFLTARMASPASWYPIRKQFVISRLVSGSVTALADEARDLKYETVREYLSGGYPKTMIYTGSPGGEEA
jgi:hypothetical protein